MNCLNNKTLSEQYNCDVIISEIGMVGNSDQAAIDEEDGGWLQGNLYLRGYLLLGTRSLQQLEASQLYHSGLVCNTKGKSSTTAGKPTAVFDAYKKY